jgi:diketogulonate reductase-like aldo/keto reductase
MPLVMLRRTVECGHLSLENGIHRFDTAKVYHIEEETDEAILKSSLNREDVYITSKRMFYFAAHARR